MENSLVKDQAQYEQYFSDPKAVVRFTKKTYVEGDCIIWGGTNHGRYGSFWIGKHVTAHRVAFFLANGYLPVVVHHTCGNNFCVNPKHLKALKSQNAHLKAHDGHWVN